MKVDLDQVLKNLDGDDILESNEPGAKSCKLALICSNGLLFPIPNEDAKKKIESFDLALRVHKGGVVDLRSEEIVLIKEKINRAYDQPLIVGAAFRLLEPPLAEVEKIAEGQTAGAT